MKERNYLTHQEVTALISAAKKQSKHYSLRNGTLIQLMFHHGLRVSEAIHLKWEQIDFANAHLHVRRLKNSKPSTHPISGDTVRYLRRLQRENNGKSPYVFISQRNNLLSVQAIQKIIDQASEKAQLGIKVHPHMLRHSTGFYLANKGHDTRAIQDYLGHVNIHHTVLYTKLSATRFKDFFSLGA